MNVWILFLVHWDSILGFKLHSVDIQFVLEVLFMWNVENGFERGEEIVRVLDGTLLHQPKQEIVPRSRWW